MRQIQNGRKERGDQIPNKKLAMSRDSDQLCENSSIENSKKCEDQHSASGGKDNEDKLRISFSQFEKKTKQIDELRTSLNDASVSGCIDSTI